MCSRGTVVKVNAPTHIYEHTGKEKVSLCSCIANAIQSLWLHGIVTLSSDCGHFERLPKLTIPEFYTDDDIAYIRTILSKEDDKDWIILQWRICKV